MSNAVKCLNCGKVQFTIEGQELCIYCDEPLNSMNSNIFGNIFGSDFNNIFGDFNENNKKKGE